MRDRIELRGLSAYGYHGCLPAERELGQEFIVDVVLELDTRKAAQTDNVADTVDYGVLSDRVVALIAGEPVNLIETLAKRIADLCLHDTKVENVEVTIHKPKAPLTVPFTDITVTIRRART